MVQRCGGWAAAAALKNVICADGVPMVVLLCGAQIKNEILADGETMVDAVIIPPNHVRRTVQSRSAASRCDLHPCKSSIHRRP